jgi:cysteine-rich repeat protein
VCGDGVRNTAAGEGCDDGNNINTDNCTNTCQPSRCGDGIVDTAAPGIEACDSGGVNTATCDFDCTAPVCGDGVRNTAAGEGCDDGNNINTDNCTNACQPSRCGDGIVDTAAPGIEACDSGGVNSATCNFDCTAARCGDGILNTAAGEVCDDGNTTNTDNCTNTCQPAHCGDGIVDSAAPNFEQCDDGNTINTDGCTNACKLAVCGDGIVRTPGEACDDGNTTTETQADCGYGQSCTACNATCSMVLNLTGPSCGDGIVQVTEGEVCDDGNNNACGLCAAGCRQIQPPSAASGTITAVAENLLGMPSTFTLRDGIHTVVFEFDTDGVVDSGADVLVNLQPGGGQTADEVAQAIVDAVNSVGPGLTITAAKVPGVPLVLLQNDSLGGFGNLAVVTTVTDPGFLVTGMSGGAAADCLSGTPCTSDGDCRSGTCSSATSPKTCQ